MATQTYASRTKKASKASPAPETTTSGPSLEALQGGAMPTQEQWGRKVDLPGAIRAKMEASFGTDFSDLELYESPTVAESGASAMTMGHKVGFAPGKLDFTSSSGQALLGHELSHVVSQARGEVSGSGFLADASLEARADREGALAAAGETVYSGPVTPLSPAASSAALAEAGPMQAAGKPWKKKPKKSKGDVLNEKLQGQDLGERISSLKMLGVGLQAGSDKEEFGLDIDQSENEAILQNLDILGTEEGASEFVRQKMESAKKVLALRQQNSSDFLTRFSDEATDFQSFDSLFNNAKFGVSTDLEKYANLNAQMQAAMGKLRESDPEGFASIEQATGITSSDYGKGIQDAGITGGANSPEAEAFYRQYAQNQRDRFSNWKHQEFLPDKKSKKKKKKK